MRQFLPKITACAAALFLLSLPAAQAQTRKKSRPQNHRAGRCPGPVSRESRLGFYP